MRKPSKKEFLRLNNIVPAASAIPRPSRKRPPRNTKMYAEAISMKENMKGTAILVNGRRIKAVDGVWYLEGHWMIVWDANREPYRAVQQTVETECSGHDEILIPDDLTIYERNMLRYLARPNKTAGVTPAACDWAITLSEDASFIMDRRAQAPPHFDNPR